MGSEETISHRSPRFALVAIAERYGNPADEVLVSVVPAPRHMFDECKTGRMNLRRSEIIPRSGQGRLVNRPAHTHRLGMHAQPPRQMLQLGKRFHGLAQFQPEFGALKSNRGAQGNTVLDSSRLHSLHQLANLKPLRKWGLILPIAHSDRWSCPDSRCNSRRSYSG